MVNKILRVGDSAAITIPKKTLHEMGVTIGDHVLITYVAKKKSLTVQPLKKGKIRVSKRITKLTLDFIDRYRTALDELAKK